MESNNTFGYQDSDQSHLVPGDNRYIKAKNFRPITELGGSNNALVNIKGNRCDLTFPRVRSVYKLKIAGTGAVTITVNGQTTASYTITASTKTSDIVGLLRTLINCYDGTYSSLKTFDVHYDDNYIYIYQLPIYKQCTAFNSTEPSVSVSDYTKIHFFDTNNQEKNINEKYIDNSSSVKPIVIGSTYIGLDQYLYTCDVNNPNETGEIWKLRYDDNTDITTLTLLYIGYLNFSKNYPIPPTATKGRYESDLLQRIYWTDNNNPVRSINVAGDNLMALSTDIINLRPSVDMNIPILKTITDGNASTDLRTDATYQLSYRLLKNNGAATNYSVCSNIVSLLPGTIDKYNSNNANYCSLTGGTGTVNKSITWNINGIDTTYDTIEFVIVKRFYPNKDTFFIYKFETKPINGTSSIDIKYTNNTSNEDEISSEEFLIENATLTHCKTIDEKDNRLFFGNVRNDLITYLDTYDTRAYRFPISSNTFEIKTYETDSAFAAPTSDYSSIPTDADAICRYNLGLSTDDDANFSNHKYQKNSTVIGGSGINISYKFGGLLINTDGNVNRPDQPGSASYTNAGTNRDLDTLNLTHKNGYRKPTGTTVQFDNLVGDQIYASLYGGQKTTLGSEYLNGHFRTGQCNEIYRYGILFKSKTGESSFVKWIGDIKFPNYSDSVAPGYEGRANDGTTCSDFRSIYRTGDNAYLNIPYVIFSVNIPTELAALVSSFEIVVVEREESDKTIISQGLVNQVSMPSTGSTEYANPAARNNKDATPAELRNVDNYAYMNPSVGSTTLNSYRATNELVAYHSFKDLCYPTQIDYTNGDKLVIVEKLQSSIGLRYLWPEGTPDDTSDFEGHFAIAKFYDHNTVEYNIDNPSSHFKIKEGKYWTTGEGPKTFNSGLTFKNTCVCWDGSSASTEDALGCPTIILNIDSTYRPFNWVNFTATAGSTGDCKLFGLHYRHSRLTTQYGGRTNADRANNEYISTGAYCKVDGATVQNIKVFGGDIFYGILDIQKAIKHDLNPSGVTQSHSQTWFVPMQSVFNVDLREGIHMNADNYSGTAGAGARSFDNYEYTLSYSYRNNLVKFIPKPLNFNENNTYVNRIYWTEPKFNNSPTDDWSTLPANNFYEVSGNQGPITSLITLNNEMYVIQENAIGRLLINQQALTTPDNMGNQPLKLGSGSTLQSHYYYSVDAGTKHQWSVISSPSEIAFFDSLRKKIYTFNGQQLKPISDVDGHRGFVNKVYRGTITYTDNPMLGYGILATYDHKNNEFLFTFLNKVRYNEDLVNDKYTLAYSTLLGKFTGFYDFTPYVYINNKVNIYSLPDYSNLLSIRIYIHDKGNYGNFYGTTYPSTIKTIINPNPLKTKMFDSLSWISESIKSQYEYIDDINDYVTDDPNIPYPQDTFNEVRCYNTYQNTDWINLAVTNPIGNLRKTEQGFNIQIPRNKVDYDSTTINTKSIFDSSVLTKTRFGERMRDKYLIVDLKYNNTDNNRFIVNNLKANYRISDR